MTGKNSVVTGKNSVVTGKNSVVTGKNSVVTGKITEPPVIMTGMRFKFISKPGRSRLSFSCSTLGFLICQAANVYGITIT